MNKVYFTKVRSIRQGLGLDLEYVATVLGIHRESYRRKEIGKFEFTASEAKKLCELFNKKFEELF